MRILFASMPADGHFNPLTGVAVQLAQRGHDVRWYAGQTYGARLDRLGMPWFPYRHATEIMASNINDLFPERAKLKGPKLISFELDTFFVSQVENHFQDISAIRHEWAFDALVCDGALYAELLVADKESIGDHIQCRQGFALLPLLPLYPWSRGRSDWNCEPMQSCKHFSISRRIPIDISIDLGASQS